MRAKPSDAVIRRLLKNINGVYAVSVSDMAKILGKSARSAARYKDKLLELGLIRLSYIKGNSKKYYKLVRSK